MFGWFIVILIIAYTVYDATYLESKRQTWKPNIHGIRCSPAEYEKHSRKKKDMIISKNNISPSMNLDLLGRNASRHE